MANKETQNIEASLTGHVLNPILYWTNASTISQKEFEVEGIQDVFLAGMVNMSESLKDIINAGDTSSYVNFGLQWVLIHMHHMFNEGFFKREKDVVLEEISNFFKSYVSVEALEHFGDLHDLGMLPVEIRALDEGLFLPSSVPMFTIRNTVAGYGWLAKYLEAGLSFDIWKQATVATLAHAYSNIANKYSRETSGVDYGFHQIYDASNQTQSGFESGAICSLGFMLSSGVGDNPAGLWASDLYYGSKVTDADCLATSMQIVDSSVSSVAFSKILKQNELLERFPSVATVEEVYLHSLLVGADKQKNIGYIADNNNVWEFLNEHLQFINEEVISRDGSFSVICKKGDPIRTISGYRIADLDANESIKGRYRSFDQLKYNTHVWWSPEIEVVKFLGEYWYLNTKLYQNGAVESFTEEKITREEALGLVEVLYNIFGGGVNEKEYKTLNPKVKAMFVGKTSLSVVDNIFSRLMEKGFDTTSVIIGIGGDVLNISREYLGLSVEPTHACYKEEDGSVVPFDVKYLGSEREAYKGLVVVDLDHNLDYVVSWGATEEEFNSQELLKPVYADGEFLKVFSLNELRVNLRDNPVSPTLEEPKPEEDKGEAEVEDEPTSEE